MERKEEKKSRKKKKMGNGLVLPLTFPIWQEHYRSFEFVLREGAKWNML